jgi:hypothetical protein
MFANTEDVESNLVGELDFVEQVPQALGRTQGYTRGRVRDGCSEAVDTDLHSGKLP